MMSDSDPATMTQFETSAATDSTEALSDGLESVVDPWAVDDTVLPDADNLPESTEKAEAISKFKESTSKLGSALSSNTAALGQKLGITEAFSAIGTSVRKVDENAKVTETVKSAGSSFGSWLSTSFSAIDQKYHVSTTSKGIGSSISAAINEVVPPELIGNAYKSTSKGLSDFDEAHGITKVTVTTLAAGADLLAGTLPLPATATSGPISDDTLALDGDGIPTSFTNSGEARP
jgi:hypothetical protein